MKNYQQYQYTIEYAVMGIRTFNLLRQAPVVVTRAASPGAAASDGTMRGLRAILARRRQPPLPSKASALPSALPRRTLALVRKSFPAFCAGIRALGAGVVRDCLRSFIGVCWAGWSGMTTRSRGAPFLSGVALVAGCNLASAADLLPLSADYLSSSDADLPVMSRLRPDYDAKGIPLGGFRLFPDLHVNATFDDNIYRQTRRTEDFFFGIAPALRLQSQWDQHMLEAYAGASNYEYTNHSQEDLTDWNGGIDGRYDVSDDISVYGIGSDSELHEALSSPNTVGSQSSPTLYNQYHAEAYATMQPNRLGVTGGGIFDHYRYQGAPLFDGSFLNNRDRNFSEYQGYGKVYYDFSAGYLGFFRAAYDVRHYDLRLDRSGLDRSSEGYKIDAGLNLQITHLLGGEIYIGYLDQNFTTPLKDVRGLDYSFKLNWLATPLLTLHLAGTRTLNPIILNNASTSDDKSLGLSADYEFRRNIIVQAHANYVDSTYPGITQHDQFPDLGVTMKYLVNRYASVDLTYGYNSRVTNVSGLKYQDNMISLGVNLHV